jgi:Flp pilus assembly protein TadG
MPNTRTKKMALDESGAVAIVVVLIFTALCGFAALAVDIGHLVRTKAELQRTADAAALAGATALVPYTGIGSPSPTPNWATGHNKAKTFISNSANQVDNYVISATDGMTNYGYWCLHGTNPTVPPVDALPKVRPVAASLPEPAITVILSKDVTLYFAPLVGVSSPKTVTVKAIAILPEAYSITNVPPLTVAEDIVGELVGSGGEVHFDVDETDQSIKIQSEKGKAGWVNRDGSNSVPSVRFQDPLTVGVTSLYITPGTEATLTNFITEGATIVIPIVSVVEAKTWQTIIGWAAFHVESLSANSMAGQFVEATTDPNVLPAAGSGSGLTGMVGGTPKLVSP